MRALKPCSCAPPTQDFLYSKFTSANADQSGAMTLHEAVRFLEALMPGKPGREVRGGGGGGWVLCARCGRAVCWQVMMMMTGVARC